MENDLWSHFQWRGLLITFWKPILFLVVWRTLVWIGRKVAQANKTMGIVVALAVSSSALQAEFGNPTAANSQAPLEAIADAVAGSGVPTAPASLDDPSTIHGELRAISGLLVFCAFGIFANLGVNVVRSWMEAMKIRT